MCIVQASDWLLDSHFCRLRLFTLLSEKKLLLFCTVCGKLTTHTLPFNDPFFVWAICKSARRSRQTTTPAPHHSVFYRPDALPDAQPTASKHRGKSTYRSRKLTNTDELLQMLNEHYKLWRNIFNVATDDKLRWSLSGQWFKLHAVIFVDHMCFVVQVKWLL